MAKKETMYDTLLQLPLFQGLSHEELTRILGRAKLHFTKHKTKEVLLKEGSNCDHLMFILSGEVRSSTLSADQSYTFTEYFQAPYLIEPQSLFGMTTKYVSTYTALSGVSILKISKISVLTQLLKYDIFALNYLNIINNRAQVCFNRLWIECPESLEGRIYQFILSHIDRPCGKKAIKIKMTDLARIINTTRISVSKALNTMQETGILSLQRGEIIIPDAEKIHHSFSALLESAKVEGVVP